MSAWLVTGGAGFIGTNFVRLLAGRTGADIVVLDALTYAGNLANIAELVDDGRVVFVRGDVCDRETLPALFEKHRFDRVVHFAAESHVDRSILGPEAFLRTNVNGTYTLLEVARQCWESEQEGKRFLHVSTDEVFGALAPDDPPFDEETPYRPNSPYSASKAASDHLVRAWHQTYGLPAIITNCSNNYGPWQFPEKLVPLMILNALEGSELPVYGDGRQVRDWIHVEDHCEGALAAIERGTPGETYAFGGGNEWANIELVRSICTTVDQLTGKQIGSSEQLIRHVTDRAGHDRRYASDASKSHRLLNWIPKHRLEDALPTIVQWYVDHQGWCADIRSGEYADHYQAQYLGR